MQHTKGWKKINVWSIKGPLLVLALLLGFVGAALDWGTTPFAAGMAVVLPVIGFRRFWNCIPFWITALLLAAIQIPLVLGVAAAVERERVPALYAFGLLDCALVASALYWVGSKGAKANE